MDCRPEIRSTARLASHCRGVDGKINQSCQISFRETEGSCHHLWNNSINVTSHGGIFDSYD
ncbi:hypothetical protein E2C01_083264 [Portunus trituberculatus]|uniref:Uncharacterized protein n=1 Tax=Portunus trituberculatus TaxID=210409 RepID=A0A5B7J1I4_PORTR|nr:hypothetical protein [Portunus trituberculatus]